MSYNFDHISYTARRLFMEARIALSVNRANSEVAKAFQFKPYFPVEKVAAYSGAGMAIIMLSIIINYTFPGFTSANIRSFSSVSSNLVKSRAVTTPLKPSRSVIAPRIGAVSSLAPLDKSIWSDLSALPKPSLSLPYPENEAVYTIVVDKSRKELFVLEETQENYKIVKRYKTSLGSELGDKKERGDKKTPEGLYRIVGVKQGADLPKKYGPMAFVLNYPNEVDLAKDKTGSGIWIHGSGLGEKTENTEGCIEISDFNILNLAEFVEKGAAVYIFPENFQIPLRNDSIQKNIISPDILYALKENIGKVAGKF